MLAILCFAAVIPDSAQAAGFRMMGYDVSAIGSGNSQVAYGDGFGVLYTNPALMSRFQEKMGASFIFYRPELKIELGKRPANADIPISIYDARVGKLEGGLDRAVPTLETQHYRTDTSVDGFNPYLGLGMTQSFGIEGFRFGSMALIPIGDVANTVTRYSDEREQYYSNQVHFTRFGEWDNMISGFLGVSYSPVKYVSLGVSVQVALAMLANINIYIPEATVQDYMLTTSKASIEWAFRPIVGVQVEPIEYLAMGLVFRAEKYIKIDGRGSINMWNYHKTFEDSSINVTVPNRPASKLSWAVDYEPMELASSVGFNYEGFKMQAVLTWERWSQFLDTSAQRPEEAAEFRALNRNDAIVNGEDYKWSDTLSVNVGAEYKYLTWATVKAGWGFSPSPVPMQKGRTNYADNDVMMVAVGHIFDFEILKHQFSAELGFQFWYMFDRVVYKDPGQVRDEFADGSVSLFGGEVMNESYGLQTNNPGFPSYKQGGWMVVSGGSLNYHF